MSRLRYCDVHGQQPENAWGCPECVREMRQQLAQPVPEWPVVTLGELLHPAYEPGDGSADGAQLVGSQWWHPVMGCDSLQIMVDNACATLARYGRPAIEPVPQQEDVHYAWELQDANGEWQAGGSANRLEVVQREGNHYLQIYMKDGPHKLIIQQHRVTTIEPETEHG